MTITIGPVESEEISIISFVVMITFVTTMAIAPMFQPMSLYCHGSNKGNTAISEFYTREASKPPVYTEISHGNKDSPVAIYGDNIYIAWWTNNTVTNINNEEIMLRVFIDGGQTFGDNINLDNTTDCNTNRVKIDSDVNSVVVTWWEANQTSDTNVLKMSNDNGITFGPLFNLAINGAIY